MKHGDIVINKWAGIRNPNRCLMYVGKSTTKQGKMYDCIAYDAKKVKFFQDDARLEVIGHMNEFDSFMDALKRLAEYDER